VAEWFKAAVLKTVERGNSFRGFKSYLLRQISSFSGFVLAMPVAHGELAEWLKAHDC
jgi:hypothetical protein